MNQDKICKWETKFKYIGKDEYIKIISCSYPEWIITEFVHTLKRGKFMYVVQPIIKQGEMEGVSGLNAFVITEEELDENFEIIKEKNED